MVRVVAGLNQVRQRGRELPLNWPGGQRQGKDHHRIVGAGKSQSVQSFILPSRPAWNVGGVFADTQKKAATFPENCFYAKTSMGDRDIE